MDLRIEPKRLSGRVRAIPSKSVAHRLMILSALSDATTDLYCAASSRDIEATRSCLAALGARLARTQRGFRIIGRPAALRRELPYRPGPLDCGESGSTLRFLLPVVGALGLSATFVGHGRLAERPLAPLDRELARHGVSLSRSGLPLKVAGQLQPGTFTLPGNVSSQYVTGLLLAAPLLEGPTTILVRRPVESEPYLRITLEALEAFGVRARESEERDEKDSYLRFDLEPTELASPGSLTVEGDWSCSAFWLAAGAASAKGIEVDGLNATSAQGDRAILAALALMGARVGRSKGSASVRRQPLRPLELDVSAIPDLVPALAVVAACAPGTSRLTHAGRLRLKESDRLATVSAALNACGGCARVEGDDLVVEGRDLTGGEVDAANDHRIAMMAAVMAPSCSGPVVVRGAECVQKSYPDFWEDYVSLGGRIAKEA